MLDGISAEMQASGVDVGGAEELVPEALPEAAPEVLAEAPVEAAPTRRPSPVAEAAGRSRAPRPRPPA